MANKIQIRRGNEADLPTLSNGELALTLDTKKLFIGTPTGNELAMNLGVAGDMEKSTYDTDNDGIVDEAESVAWAGIQNIPSQVTNLTQTVIDDSHDSTILGTKTIDETNIANGKVIKYNSTSGNLEYADDNGGSGGSGNVTSTGDVGSEPASPIAGDLYLAKNFPVLARYSGTAWEKFLGIQSLYKKPVVSDFTWINQQAASAADTELGLRLSNPAQANDDLSGLLKSMSWTSTYKVTIGMNVDFAGQYNRGGLFVRNSATGTMLTLGTIIRGDRVQKIAEKLTSEFVINSSYTALYHYKDINWYQLENNGTSRFYKYSNDGVNWVTFHTTTNTDFMAGEDQVGLYLIINASAFPAAINFFYLDVETT
jgi:hypothetical protein